MEKMRAEKEEAIRQRDEAKKIAQEKREEAYQARTQAEEVQQKNDALTARIKKDYTNSSKPSSMNPNHKSIHNSRESSGKKANGKANGVGTFVKLRYAGPIRILSCWMTLALEKVIS